MALTIDLEEHHDYVLLDIIGTIDASNAEIVARHLDFAINKYDKHLLIEGSNLKSINITGLRVFLNAKQKMSFFKMMILCNIPTAIMALIELSGITSVIPIVSDIIEAEIILQDMDLFNGHIPQNSDMTQNY
ncbi:MAG: STAS domain-containing protein [Candidatus Endonucleobacter bathymodioli]|uniref:STAS domain-containing protein n=1 Tax=Candidatus Endonucleibacter bathymodioli TaxID=539814 RepID=A0AA90SY12_9GAMM|nr:STAS domain-containing protein [Candidatus Endonucleobacter bathymodioli]